MMGPLFPEKDDLTLTDVRALRRMLSGCWTTHLEMTPLRIWLMLTAYASAIRNEFIARQTYLAKVSDAEVVRRYLNPDVCGVEMHALAFELRRRYGTSTAHEAIERAQAGELK